MLQRPGAITLALRLSFVLLLGEREIPPILRSALRFVPPSTFSAIVLPELFTHGGTLNLSVENTRLLAGALAVIVAWRTRNVLLTIAAGMGGLWLLQALFR
ncbi:MAG: AzlD domain-containing protein [Chloroflexi bacterium]|nr:AzlD domain-containing protein [Chloroflexota bacterium]